MARSRRDFKSEYAERNARARALGFRSYYDYRVRGTERGSEERAQARGHRAQSDFLASVGRDDLIMLPQGLAAVERDSQGRYVEIVVTIIDGETGRERTYTLRNLTPAQVRALIDDIADAGAGFSPAPSLDIRRLPAKG